MTILFAIERFELGGIISYLETLISFLTQQGIRVIIMGGIDRQKDFPFKKHFKS